LRRQVQVLRMHVKILRRNEALKTKMVKNLAREVELLDVLDEDSEDYILLDIEKGEMFSG
jgi:hypothetical protein